MSIRCDFKCFAFKISFTYLQKHFKFQLLWGEGGWVRINFKFKFDINNKPLLSFTFIGPF